MHSKIDRIIHAFLWCALSGLMVSLMAVPAAAQCVVRTEWPVYVVQRGDTLARIAGRYGTNANVLANANCLANINRIYVGQQLRVPPSAVVLPTTPPIPAPVSSYQLRVNIQQFERGFMVWRADNSGITAYFGGTNGTLRDFPASGYGRLPDNPIPDVPPPGFVRPVFGFGKVWGNYSDVRSALGWAVGGEQGYITTVTRYANTLFDFTLPNGNRVLVSGGSRWSLNGTGVLPPTPMPTWTPIAPPSSIVTNTWAAYQPFENGFFIWEANTGNVVVFYNSGVYRLVTLAQYGGLPDNPVAVPTPAGRVRPTNAFGKVWGNYADIRFAVGWALVGESGFDASFRTSSTGAAVGTCFALPDSRIVRYTMVSGAPSWQFVTFCA